MDPGRPALHQGARVGPRSTATWPPSGSPPTPPTSSATSSSSSCPTAGRALEQFATFGVVESVKAVSDLFAPVGGEVVEANAALAPRPSSSTPTRTGPAGCSASGSPTRRRSTRCWTPAAYEALVAEA